MTKKTDKNKAWNRITSSKYRINSIPVSKNILIVCEGQTEYYYFDSFDVLNLTVHLDDTEGMANKNISLYCDELIKRYKKKKINIDEVWCVFDLDIKSGGKQFSDFDNAINSCISKGYKVAYSNDAFELWFYLHFDYTDEENHRKFYYKKLSSWWGKNYEKHCKKEEVCKKNYFFLNNHNDSSQSKAIERAKKLHESMEYLPYHQQNPVTTVYKLVRLLNKHLRGISKSHK